MTRGLFITGTGTGVGKTYVAALIARALRDAGHVVGVYKPVASGCDVDEGRLISQDAMALWKAAGRPGTLEQVCPQLFRAALAPHLAARAEGRRVAPRLLREGLQHWLTLSEIVLIEGAGGLLSPISDDDYNADLAADFGFPLVVVAANELGVINATLQTLTTAGAWREGLPVAGVVLNSARILDGDESVDSNADELGRRCSAPLLAAVDHGGALNGNIDWYSLAAAGRRLG